MVPSKSLILAFCIGVVSLEHDGEDYEEDAHATQYSCGDVGSEPTQCLATLCTPLRSTIAMRVLVPFEAVQ